MVSTQEQGKESSSFRSTPRKSYTQTKRLSLHPNFLSYRNLLYTTDTQSNPDLASVLSPTVSTSPPISALSLHSIALACLHLSCKFHENLINLSRIQSIYKQHAFLYYSSTSILDNSSITLNDPLFTNFINIADLYVISELEYYVLNIWLHYLPSSVKTTMNTLKDNKQNYISLHSDHSMDTGESAVFPPSLTTAYPPSSSTTTTVSTPFVQYYLQNYHKYLLSLPIIRAVQIQYPFEIIERQVLYLSSRLIQRFTLVSFLSATSAISSSSSSTPSVSSLVWPNFHNSTQDLSENVGYQYSNLLSTVVYPLSCLAYIYLPDIISDLVAIPYSIEGTVSTLSTTSGSMTTSGDVLFAIAIIYVSVYRMCNEPIEYVTNAIETGNSTSSLSNTSNDTMESSPSLGPTGSSSSSPVNSESSNNGGTFTTLQKENRIVWEEVYKWLLEFPFLWNELFNDTSLPLPSLIESKEDTSSDTMDSLKSQTFVTLVQELKILVQYIQ